MPGQPVQEMELLRAAYAAFNARDFDAAFATMAPSVEWPRAFKGGVVRGHDEIRAYWAEQWSVSAPHVEPSPFIQKRTGAFSSKSTKLCAPETAPFLSMNRSATVSRSKTV